MMLCYPRCQDTILFPFVASLFISLYLISHATQESVMDHPEDFIRTRIFLSLAISEPEYLHLLGSFMHQIFLVRFVSVKYHLQV